MVEVHRSTLTSGPDNTGITIYDADAITMTDSTVNAALTAFLLLDDQTLSLTNTDVVAGKWGVAVFGSSGPVTIDGGSVDAAEQALILRGVEADLSNATFSSTVGPTIEAYGYGSVDGEVALDGVDLVGGTAGAANFGSLDVLDIDNSTFTGDDNTGDDVYLLDNASTWELDSGSTGFLCGETSCVP